MSSNLSQQNDVFSPDQYEDWKIKRVLQEKNLLVVSHSYKNFTKEQIDRLASYFNKVHVYVRYNRFTDIGRVVGSDYLQSYGRKAKIAENSPKNVNVHHTPLVYLPIQFWRRHLGKQHYRAVKKQVAETPTDFDLIHAHFSWTAGYVGSRLSEDLDIPNVTTVHENTSWLSSELNSENDALYFGWRFADALVRVNKNDCTQLTKFNPTVYYIPNGFSRDRFPLMDADKVRDEIDVRKEKKIIFTLSSLIPRKNIDMLIEAVARLEAENPIYCAIGGEGPEKSRLQSKVENLDIDHEIELLGFVSEDELPLWMNACDVFTLTSNAEGNPTVMFEALGCGKPYIGTDVGGVDGVITSDEYGLLSPPGEIEPFVSNLERGICRDWNHNKIREYGEQYTWDNITRELCNVFLETIEQEKRQNTKAS